MCVWPKSRIVPEADIENGLTGAKQVRKGMCMKALARILLLVALVVGFTHVAMATTDTDTQSVTITFSEISELAASGDPGTLTIAAPATAGDLPAD